MGKIIIGSARDKKGFEVNPYNVLFNSNNVKQILKKGTTIEIWKREYKWFYKGKVDSSTLGSISFWTMGGHAWNSGTYSSDGFLHMYIVKNESRDGVFTTANVIPRNVFSKVILEVAACSNTTYGLSNSKSNYNFSSSQTTLKVGTNTLDLSSYNNGGTNLYLKIYADVGEVKIKSIRFVYK